MAAPAVRADSVAPPGEKPSFTRGLFAGAVHDSLLFPFPRPLDQRNPTEAAVVRTLIRKLREMNADLIDPEKFDEEETIPEEVIRAFAEAGLLALTIPKKYGGLEVSATAYARVFEEISSIDGSLGVLVGVHCGLGSKAIVLFGNDAQKERFLPSLARGDYLAAYALTEPETGSDAQNIVTSAALADDGVWILNGRKIWIGNGHRAGVIATFAQTELRRKGEKTRRPTAFLLTPDLPGFSVAGTVRKMGIRGSTQAELVYKDLRVPPENVLGTVGKGFSVAVHVLNGGRLTLAAGCTGATKRVLSEMARYAEQRVQFGHPLAHFEITQRKMSTLAADTYASDAMLGILASLVDHAEADFSLETACAKVFASDLIWRATDEMVQLAGGRGFVKPYPYERMLRDARINRIFEGANEVLRLFIALNGVQGPAESLKEIGSALRRPLRNLGLLSGFAASRLRSIIGATGTVDVEVDERIQKHKEYFEKHVRDMRAATDRSILRHRKQIVDRQFVLERLANMAIELVATASVLSRTQSIIERGTAQEADEAIQLCGLFCVESGRRFRDARNLLDSSEDDVDDARRSVAAAVRTAKGYMVEDALLKADSE